MLYGISISAEGANKHHMLFSIMKETDRRGK